MATDRPRAPARIPGHWPALLLAIAVNVVFIAVLFFSIRWQNRQPEPVTAELYAPRPRRRGRRAAEPPPTRARAGSLPRRRRRSPHREAAPADRPRRPCPKPEPKVEKPDTRAADIARKAKAEEERKAKEAAERERKEREKKGGREARGRQEEAGRAAARRRGARAAGARGRRELKAQAEREKATRDAQQKAVDADAAARSRAEADYIRRIQAKVKGNVVLPPDMNGNPEAIFEVVQLPTGEIIDTVLRKSSGVRAYDEAVQRAIQKSSPLPRPDRPELFQRTLTLKFRPQD